MAPHSLTPRQLQALDTAVGLLMVLGYLLIVAGVALIHIPAALIVAGAGLLTLGQLLARRLAATPPGAHPAGTPGP